MRKFQYIDLFAGCGGLSLGLSNSKKWAGCFAVERSLDAFETLKSNLIDLRSHFNWPNWLECKNHEINFIIEEKSKELRALRGKINLVAGGPPCQGFSSAGRRIEKDSRNELFYEYLKFIELVQPDAFIFENVAGFKLGFRRSKKEVGTPFSDLLLRRLWQIGYTDSRIELLDFSHYGVPQTRSRCIIVGTKTKKADLFFDYLSSQKSKFLKSKGLKCPVTIEEAISDLHRSTGQVESPDTDGFHAGKYAEHPNSAYQNLMRSNNSTKFPDSHRFANHTKLVEERLSTIIREKLTLKEIRERFKIKKKCIHLLLADHPSRTLTTLPDDYIHYKEPRILTVREYARIQSFPDSFKFKGKYTTGGKARKTEVPRYSQIGNAIPPLFAELAGLSLANLLET